MLLFNILKVDLLNITVDCLNTYHVIVQRTCLRYIEKDTDWFKYISCYCSTINKRDIKIEEVQV